MGLYWFATHEMFRSLQPLKPFQSCGLFGPKTNIFQLDQPVDRLHSLLTGSLDMTHRPVDPSDSHAHYKGFPGFLELFSSFSLAAKKD